MKRLIWNRHTKRILKHLAGWLFILAGIVMLFIPGQGLLSILIGIYMLADEIPFFGRIKDRINHKYPKVAAFAHRHLENIKARFQRRQ